MTGDQPSNAVDSFVKCGFSCGSFSLIHYISTVQSSGVFLDGYGRLNKFSGATWQTLNKLKEGNLYRAGYCLKLPERIEFICFNHSWLTDQEAAGKRERFQHLDRVMPFVDYHELKTIIEVIPGGSQECPQDRGIYAQRLSKAKISN